MSKVVYFDGPNETWCPGASVHLMNGRNTLDDDKAKILIDAKVVTLVPDAEAAPTDQVAPQAPPAETKATTRSSRAAAQPTPAPTTGSSSSQSGGSEKA